jgi:uncharacterized protein
MRRAPRSARGRRVALVAAALAVMAALTAPAKAALGPTGTAWTPQAAIYGLGSSLNMPVKASDGTILRADVYYPTNSKTGRPASGPFPVLLQQTPYGKESVTQSSAQSIANTDVPYLVDRGYMVVVSDVRGTGDSGGTWGLFDPIQATDGATVARWASRLPHSDGRVGLFGESYMGINQFLTVAAAGKGSPIKAMFPIIAGHDIYSDTVAQGGIPDVEFSSFYIALVAGLNAANPLLEPLAEMGTTQNADPLVSTLPSLASVEAQHSKAITSTDVASLQSVETGGTQAFDGPYWAGRSPESYLEAVIADRIPAFLMGGWNDLFQQGELLNYAALQNLYDGRPAAAPMIPNQRVTPRYQLMMGPWMHVTAGQGVNTAAIELEWFDTWLLGEATPLRDTPTPLHLEQLNSGKWLDSTTWPVPSQRAQAWYFASGKSGSDPASSNDGGLTTAAPTATSGSDQVAWAPFSSPCDVQTDQWAAGFARLAAEELKATDPCDTNDVTLGAGPDALTYTSAPFKSDEVLAGPIDATVYATSTTSDTELAATVEEVSPSGDSVPLTSGALLGSLRKVDTSASWVGSDGRYLLPSHPYTAASSEPVVAGRVTRYDITVFPTFADIPAGWRLRVTLTTADTPHLFPTAVQLPHLLGGVYQIERHAGADSYLNVPLAPASTFTTPCGALCSPTGP